MDEGRRRYISFDDDSWQRAAALPAVRVLLDAGADPDVRANGGITPLHVAASDGHDASIVEALIDAGADPNSRTDLGETALVVAAANAKDPAIIQVLLDAVADTAATALDGRNAWDHAQLNDALNDTEILQKFR